MKNELCKLGDIPNVGAKTIDFFGRTALVSRNDKTVIATVAICPHLGGPLELRDGKLICPWHNAQFDAHTGQCLHWPKDGERANNAMQLPTRIEGDALFYVWGE
jgi:nitrite reductase/ring-hydroxylating ferredoxin subunit